MELEYKIITSAELAGAEAAADALERNIGKTKALKQDSSALDAQLKTMRESIDEAKKAHVGSGEAMTEEGFFTKKLTLGKRELSESLRGLTRQYPMLGEVARAVFNPIVMATFGIIEAFTIWKSRVDTLVAALGGIELPDLGEHITQAENVATAYHGIAEAVEAADVQFDSAASIFERAAKATAAQLAATKLLITAMKEKALAELDMEKAGGNMTETDYAARKSRIETGASNATVQAEIDARAADLQHKKDEVKRLAAAEETARKKAAAIPLPQSDLVAAAAAAEYTDIAAAHKKEADAAEARKKGISALIDDLQGGPRRNAGAQLDLFKFSTKYGALTDPNDALKMEADAESNARADQRAAEKKAAEIERDIKDRAKLREQSEKAAADKETAQRGIEGQDDPTVVGSVAWQDAQARKTQAIHNVTDTEKNLAGDEKRTRDDAKWLTDFSVKTTITAEDIATAKAKIKDMQDAMADAVSLVQLLAAAGNDVSKLATELAQVRQIALQAKFAADHK